MLKSALCLSLALGLSSYASIEAQGTGSAPAAFPTSIADSLSADCAGVAGYVKETASSGDTTAASRAGVQYHYWIARYIDANNASSVEAERAAKTQLAALAETSMSASIQRHGQNGQKQAEDLASSIGRMFQRCEQIHALEAENG